MSLKKESKASEHVLEHMKKLRSSNEVGRLGHEDGSPMKEDHVHKDSPESAEKKNPGKDKPEYIKEGSFLDHPRVHAISQHKLINDTAYFLHHPQLALKGPAMPPQSPSEGARKLSSNVSEAPKKK